MEALAKEIGKEASYEPFSCVLMPKPEAKQHRNSKKGMLSNESRNDCWSDDRVSWPVRLHDLKAGDDGKRR
jgi:hypothetical protein